MKYILVFLLLLSGVAYGQTTYFIRADSTRLQKVGGSNELIIENDTRDSLGVLVNIGKGRTAFQRGRISGDTLFLGRDTIVGVGGGGLGSGVITPPEITSNENNYNPTGLAGATTVRISADAAWNITGLEGGVEGRVVVLQNVGTGDITLTAQDGDSDPENQFSQAIYLEDGLGVIALRYDGVLEKWVPLTSPFAFGAEDGLDVWGGRQFNSNNNPFEIFNFESFIARLENEAGNDNTAEVKIDRNESELPFASMYASESTTGEGKVFIDNTVVLLQSNRFDNQQYGNFYLKYDTAAMYAIDYSLPGDPSSYLKLDPTHAHIYGDSSWTEWSNDEGIEEYPWLGRYRIDSLTEHLASDTVDLKLMFWKYDTDPDEMGVVYQMNLQDFIALLPGGGGSGTVTEVTATDANGFNFTVTDGTTTPNITLETTVTSDQVVVANAGDIIGYGSFTFTDADDIAMLTVGESGGSRGAVLFQNASNSFTLYAPGSGTNEMALPTNAGTEGQVLTKGATNTTSWEDPSGGFNQFAGDQALGSAIKAESMGVEITYAAASLALTDGQARYHAVYIPTASTITGVKFFMRTQGNFTGDNNNRVALYSYSGGTLTQVATSANDENIWKATGNTWATAAFTAPYAAAAGIYYVGYIYNSSAQTTAPAIAQAANMPSANMASLDYTNSAFRIMFLNSQSNISATTVAASTLGGSASPVYFYLY